MEREIVGSWMVSTWPSREHIIMTGRRRLTEKEMTENVEDMRIILIKLTNRQGMCRAIKIIRRARIPKEKADYVTRNEKIISSS